MKYNQFYHYLYMYPFSLCQTYITNPFEQFHETFPNIIQKISFKLKSTLQNCLKKPWKIIKKFEKYFILTFQVRKLYKVFSHFQNGVPFFC